MGERELGPGSTVELKGREFVVTEPAFIGTGPRHRFSVAGATYHDTTAVGNSATRGIVGGLLGGVTGAVIGSSMGRQRLLVVAYDAARLIVEVSEAEWVKLLTMGVLAGGTAPGEQVVIDGRALKAERKTSPVVSWAFLALFVALCVTFCSSL